jgi:hypothetical protein
MSEASYLRLGILDIKRVDEFVLAGIAKHGASHNSCEAFSTC